MRSQELALFIIDLCEIFFQFFFRKTASERLIKLDASNWSWLWTFRKTFYFVFTSRIFPSKFFFHTRASSHVQYLFKTLIYKNVNQCSLDVSANVVHVFAMRKTLGRPKLCRFFLDLRKSIFQQFYLLDGINMQTILFKRCCIYVAGIKRNWNFTILKYIFKFLDIVSFKKHLLTFGDSVP